MAFGGSGGPCKPNRSGLFSSEPGLDEAADDVPALPVFASLDLGVKALVIEVRRGTELMRDGPLLRRGPPLACLGVLWPDLRRTWLSLCELGLLLRVTVVLVSSISNFSASSSPSPCPLF